MTLRFSKQPQSSEDREKGFDDYALEYEALMTEGLRFSGESPNYFDTYKINCLRRWAGNSGNLISLLDFGCGIGNISALIAKNFSHGKVCGYDISPKSIEIAQKKWGHLENLFFINTLSKSSKFDLIIVSNVFHHISLEQRSKILLQLINNLSEQGKIVIFEHNPFNPFTRHIVKNCPFDKGVELIKMSQFIKLAESCGLGTYSKQYIVFFPKFLSFLRRFESFCGAIPMGAQYMLVLGLPNLVGGPQ